MSQWNSLTTSAMFQCWVDRPWSFKNQRFIPLVSVQFYSTWMQAHFAHFGLRLQLSRWTVVLVPKHITLTTCAAKQNSFGWLPASPHPTNMRKTSQKRGKVKRLSADFASITHTKTIPCLEARGLWHLSPLHLQSAGRRLGQLTATFRDKPKIVMKRSAVS